MPLKSLKDCNYITFWSYYCKSCTVKRRQNNNKPCSMYDFILKLWIRLEILNYKFGEGFVKLWKKWWQNKQQGETFKNEELGINFQRITTVFACITTHEPDIFLLCFWACSKLPSVWNWRKGFQCCSYSYTFCWGCLYCLYHSKSWC